MATHCGEVFAGIFNITEPMLSEKVSVTIAGVFNVIKFDSAGVVFLVFGYSLFFHKLKYLSLMPRAAQNAVADWPDVACS